MSQIIEDVKVIKKKEEQALKSPTFGVDLSSSPRFGLLAIEDIQDEIFANKGQKDSMNLESLKFDPKNSKKRPLHQITSEIIESSY